MSLIAELQRRKVFKVAVAYGVLAVLAIGGYWQSQSSLIYHDKLIRLQFGDDPRYQALMRQIETRFEKL